VQTLDHIVLSCFMQTREDSNHVLP